MPPSILFLSSFLKYFNTHYVPGTVLGTQDNGDQKWHRFLPPNNFTHVELRVLCSAP